MVPQNALRLLLIAFLVGSCGLSSFDPVTAQEGSETPNRAARTAIDAYVNQPDDSYSWEIVSSNQVDGATIVVVDMVSQTWLTKEQVDRTQWQHWLTLVIPDELRANVGFLMISGGSNGGKPPSTAPREALQLAKATGTVAAELRMVPNQPLIFHGDGVPRKEDDLIGYTWDQFLKTGEPLWLARNAMVKSAIRAMDTMSAVVKQHREMAVERFVIAGASKRGWTTWLTGAIDPRVVGIVPIVIDILNVDASMRHHFAAYGYWAPAVGDYVDHQIMTRLDEPRLKELYELVDPYAYRERLDMPKFILNAAGDQFFLPDSSRFYYDDLPGEKHLRYIPNTDHGMKDTDALESVVAFYSLIAHDQPRPEYAWSLNEAGEFEVVSESPVKEVRLWQATNPETRDFRLESLGPKYTSRTLSADEHGVYHAQVPAPDRGWTAYLVELTYDIGGPVPLKVTTGVHVTPQTLPYADRDPARAPSVTLQPLLGDDATWKVGVAAAKSPRRNRCGWPATGRVTNPHGEPYMTCGSRCWPWKLATGTARWWSQATCWDFPSRSMNRFVRN